MSEADYQSQTYFLCSVVKFSRIHGILKIATALFLDLVFKLKYKTSEQFLVKAYIIFLKQGNCIWEDYSIFFEKTLNGCPEIIFT